MKIFLSFGTYLSDTLYLFEQRYKHPWLFFEAKRGPRAEKIAKRWSTAFDVASCGCRFVCDLRIRPVL